MVLWLRHQDFALKGSPLPGVRGGTFRVEAHSGSDRSVGTGQDIDACVCRV